jgi:hypothetical protein
LLGKSLIVSARLLSCPLRRNKRMLTKHWTSIKPA